MTRWLEEFENALLAIDRLKAQDLITRAKKEWGGLQTVETLIVPTLKRIGLGWEKGGVALSQVYMCGRICEDLVKNILLPEDSEQNGRSGIAISVLEDSHLLGKRVVYCTLRAAGFSLLDFGQVTVNELVDRVRENRIKILLISVLMLPSALRIKDLRRKLDQEGLVVRIVVGGAPFNFDDQLWKEVGADAMGRNAAEAVQILKQIEGGES